jgi:hypothetical protein
MDSGNLLAAVLLVVVLCRRSARPLRNLPVEIFLFQVGHVRPGVGHFTDSPVPGTEPGLMRRAFWWTGPQLSSVEELPSCPAGNHLPRHPPRHSTH